MDSLTVNSIIAELEQMATYEDALRLGCRVRRGVLSGSTSPFLALDVYDQSGDLMKARNFMVGVITG